MKIIDFELLGNVVKFYSQYAAADSSGDVVKFYML